MKHIHYYSIQLYSKLEEETGQVRRITSSLIMLDLSDSILHCMGVFHMAKYDLGKVSQSQTSAVSGFPLHSM